MTHHDAQSDSWEITISREVAGFPVAANARPIIRSLQWYSTYSEAFSSKIASDLFVQAIQLERDINPAEVFRDDRLQPVLRWPAIERAPRVAASGLRKLCKFKTS